MLRSSSFCLLVLIDAQLFSGLHAFQNPAFRGVLWATSTGELPTSKAKNRRRCIESCNQRSIGLLFESLTEGDEVAKQGTDDNDLDPNKQGTTAATNTINERLMAELQEAEETEKFGSKNKKLSPVDGFGRARKSDAEREAAIAAARDLNGVNPWVAIIGSFFALGVAVALWIATNKLGGFFAAHPPETEVYFVQRSAQVFRNVVMGMTSLASGFFGVTGLGIFGMGVRVAYGVITGELDPTPIKSRTAATKESVDVGKMMDLMMNKKPGRRGGKRN